MRGPRLDAVLREQLRLGQRWLHRDTGLIARVAQIHRADRSAELVTTSSPDAGDRLLISFPDLAAGWDLLLSVDQLATTTGSRP